MRMTRNDRSPDSNKNRRTRAQRGKASAVVAVKDLRPLARRACSRVLDRDPRCGWNLTYGSVPAPCFYKTGIQKGGEENRVRV